ncbi:MAG: hypothetical protein CME59_02245 [Halioglobus sp.]|nr:hypothetical protein [Halioglobus sp.]|tara:strand:- start:2242 stop:2427 length:186 start_codon:yes stop_codon:yes gene_type:complete
MKVLILALLVFVSLQVSRSHELLHEHLHTIETAVIQELEACGVGAVSPAANGEEEYKKHGL